MRQICILAAFLLLCHTGKGQKRKLDSLHNVLTLQKSDTLRLKTQLTLAQTHVNTNYDSAIYYAVLVMAAPNNPKYYKWKRDASNTLGYANYLKGNYDAAIKGFENYSSFAEKMGDPKGVATGINNVGNVYIETGNYQKALVQYKQALKVREGLNDSVGVALTNNNIGFIYKDLGEYEKAVSYFLSSLRTLERLKVYPTIASTLNFLGSVFFRKKDYTQAIDYHNRALALQEKYNLYAQQAISHISLGSIYAEQEKFQTAIDYFQKADRYYTDLKDYRQIAIVKKNLGELYHRQKMEEKALPYLMEALELDQRIGNRRSIGSTWLQTAIVSINLKNLTLARSLIDSATLLAKNTDNKELLKSAYEAEADYYAATSNFKEALAFKSKYDKQKDALLNEANIKSLTDMRIKYETEKKEAQISLLNKDNAIKELEIRNQKLTLADQLYELTENKLALSEAGLELATNELKLKGQEQIILKQKLDSTQRAKNIQELKRQSELQQLEIANRQLQLSRRNVMIGLLAAVSLLGGLLGYSFYRRKQLEQEAKLQAEVLRQQEMATKAILEAEEAERQRIAKDLHDGVGQMMSAAKMNLSAYEHQVTFASADAKESFDKIISLVDDSCKEVRAVSHNMMPNALLKNSLAAAVREFIDKLDHKALKVHLYTDGLDNRLDSNVETVLYRVIQECVNNVIKHADANVLDLSIVKDSQEITVTVEDNGKGFDTSNGEKFEGIGLKNIRTRIEYLKGSVDFESTPGRGTLVSIHIPL